MAMEIAAVAKSGVHIYRIPEDGEANQTTGDPVATLPCVGSAFGYAWSEDGTRIASVDQGKTIVWDAEKDYKQILEIAGVGESGGARAVLWSPKGSFLFTFEKFDKDKCPENMHVWDLRNSPNVKKVRSLALRSYQSGKVSADMIQWSLDETLCLELLAGEGIVVLDADLQAGETHRLIPEVNATQFAIAPAPQNEGYNVALYIPEAANAWGAWDLTGRAGEVVVYHVTTSDIKKVGFQTLPRKLNTVNMWWNAEGTALLAQANSDVDETGESYFGTTSLYWIKADGKTQTRISGPEDGLVQDVAWAPKTNEFMLIIGMMPATTKLYDGKTGKLVKDGNLGTSRRNTIRWNPFGRFACVGGFGALPGDLDFFDRTSGETLCSFRANLTVNCSWAPSGRHFLTCTTTPRMNEDNQFSVWGYCTGNLITKVDFKPETIRTGGGAEGGRAAADAGAMLWAASWRPDGKGAFKDRAASPAAKGVKRVKGIPADSTSGGGAYKVKGQGFSGVAAMMRGELPAPDAAGSTAAVTGGWAPTAPQPTWEEQAKMAKDWEKEKKALAKKKKEDEEEAKQAKLDKFKDLEKDAKDSKKLLQKLKEELAELEKLKDKDWDELTEEDEAQLEGEIDIRDQIAKLEKGK